VTRLFKKSPNFLKSSQKSFQPKKCPNIFIKAQLKRPKLLHQIAFETLKSLQQTMLRNKGENIIILRKQKIAQNVAITLGYLILQNHNEHPKVAQIGEKSPNLVAMSQFVKILFSRTKLFSFQFCLKICMVSFNFVH
jgi:hypothetical protein